MFAIVASRVARDVTLINFQLDRDHGTRPPSDQRKEWPAIDINARNLPELLDTIHNIASVTRPDFVIASLVSLPSLMLGLSLRECSDCRLVLDINKNYTTPHCNSPTEVELERLLSTAYFPQSVDAPRPTPLMETLISEADAITVCDAALQGRFGGLLVPSQDDAVGASIADTDPIVATSLQTIFSHIAPPPADRHNSVSARLVAALRSATTHAPPPPDGADIVVFWKQNDTTLYGRRHDMVIKYLASRTDVRRIVVFDLPISIHDLNKFRDAGTEQASEYRHLYIRTQKKSLEIMDEEKIAYRSFIYHPDIDHSINVTSSSGVSLEGHFYDFVASVLDRENVRTNDAIFWVYPRNPFIEALVDIFRPKRIVVDVVDDHRAWPGVTAEQKAELTEHYRSVLALADFSFANCEPVAAAMRRFSPTIQLIPNGCEIEPIICEPAWSEAFETFKTWQGKIIGYVGNLEEKIDLDLLHKLARTFPDCLIVLVGSTHANPASRNLTRHANVMMPGVLPYNEIGAWVSRFSIGIIPHRIMDLTKSMNPLKLFVYASHGIPVVATDIPNLSREWAGLFVAVDHDDFLYQVRQCLDNPIKPHKSSDFVERNSWKRRLDKVVSKIIR
ncbi:MAG: hypothetical protein BGP16_06840 [Sphingobium sp. 66-54]|nr:MAG: hypothetical protein BGP16_06840 [Sphingobium sp. 66-54]